MANELDTVSLANGCGVRLECIRVGAAITSLQLPNGTDIVLSFKDRKDYRTNSHYIGCVVGRVTNRIKGASFVIDGREHHLTANDPPNHLHGGTVGFNKVAWELKSHGSNEVVFELTSPAGTEGYPGTLTCSVTYRLTDENEVHLTYTAVTDAPTIVSLTNHTYFNLAGKGEALNHILCIAADQTTDLNGEISSVADKETDFRVPTVIKDNMTGTASNGFDCNYSLLGVEKMHDKDESLRICGVLQDPSSGNEVQVFSDQPGLQFYTGNFLDSSSTGKDGLPLAKHSGICLETQAWPNAINIKGAEGQVILRPGGQYVRKTVWKLKWRS
jgi:aldose 1-epimerase